MTAPAHGSLLSPLRIGFHLTDPHLDPVDEALTSAQLPVVPVVVDLNLLLQGEKKFRPVRHTRRIAQRFMNDGNRYFRLVDTRGGEGDDIVWPRWRWEVRWRSVENTDPATTGTSASVLVRIDVTRYRMTDGMLDSAVQLALLRHSMVHCLRAVDSNLDVVAGRHDWDPAWWTVAQAE